MQLSVSKGPERFTVDGGLLGQPADDVQATIEGLGADLQVTRTTGRSDDVAAGAVMALDPAPGTELRRGDTVTLQVSEGPATAAVPDLVGSDPDDAEATLAALGFEVERTEGRSDAVSAGQVAAVSPDGTETFGATITLTVSVGPVQVSVPNVVGQSKDAAVAALEAVGLEASVTQFFGDTVLRQTPAAGEVVDPGTSVTILVTFG
ncbi:PASTA domain-containing protein [Klenkia terrae]|uniref:PASTA domain-containing protein n=1 Tax=Klenkia terrae TaxID=1052259 RepID=UPI00360C8E10